MSTSRTLSPQTLEVLEAFLKAAGEWRYGYDISRETGLKSGTLYPVLIRLAEQKLLEATWEASEPGIPPRHLYRLTSEGRQFARHYARRRTKARVRCQAVGDAKS